MIFDQPHMYEIEDMIGFCRKYAHVYIYGNAEKQEYLLKFFDICGIPIEGYVVTYPDCRPLQYRDMPVKTLEEVAGNESTGLLLGLSDHYFDCVIPKLRELGISDYFVLSEHNKRTIAHKLTPRARERMWIEINLVDHCNLNCQMCDHFSQIADAYFLDIHSFRRDMERLAELSDHHIDIIKLQGGEPLLHNDINEFIAVTRELFPRCHIYLFTNGLRLMQLEKSPRGNIWQVCRDNDVEIQLTVYPVNLNVAAIEEKAHEYGVKICVFGNVANRLRETKFSVRHPFDLTGSQEKHRFISCYQLNESIALKDGKLYTCPIIPYVHYFNSYFGQKLEVCDADFLDIYEAQSYEELAEFVAQRPPFCRYCDVKNRTVHPWQRSQKELSEYV